MALLLEFRGALAKRSGEVGLRKIYLWGGQKRELRKLLVIKICPEAKKHIILLIW